MGDAASRRRLASILLARKPRFTDSGRNDTTASAESRDGYTMSVSFWMADPPELSLFSIHCTKDGKRCNFSRSPRVVGADGPFVLLRAVFKDSVRREYFLYRADDEAPASLERIPAPSPSPGDDLRGVRELGILTQGGGGHYLLAALRDAPDDDDDGYEFRIYSSETGSWSTRTLCNPCPGVDKVIPDKVITLGGQEEGLLGWVDLSHGILVCNLLLLLLQHQDDQEPPAGAISLIPLPEPLPGNMYKQKYPIIPPTQKVNKHPLVDEPYRSTSWFRDLTCVNGVLKFIEMENPAPPENKDNIVYDSDLIMSLKRKAIDGNSKQQLSSFRDDWRAVTWSRKLVSSSNFWRQTCATHVADIKGELLERYSAFPILSPEDDDDIIYLRSLLEPSDKDGSVVAVDVGNKTVKATGQYYLPDDFYYSRPYDSEHPFRACTLSRHLDMTPGIEVSACRKITEAGSSANHTSNTSIPCKPRTTIQSLSELDGRIKRARNPTESIIQNPRISQAHPVESNLPQERKWDTTPEHSLWLHQNNMSWQQCFNKPYGPCGPGYASLAPVHGRHNYQPPSKQAPQPCFNNRNGAGYLGYSQQLSASNSFTYGAPTGYGNYQQQLPPTLELHIVASWQDPPPPPGTS